MIVLRILEGCFALAGSIYFSLAAIDLIKKRK